MGLFNFFYKLTNILSNKRKLRVFVIIVLIFLILFCWNRGAFASSATEISPENNMALMNYQLILQDSMISYLEFLYSTEPTGFNKTNADLMLNSMRYNEIVVMPSTDLYSIWDVYIYSPNTSSNNMAVFNTDADWSINFNQSTQYPCKVGIIECKTLYQVRNIWSTTNPTPIYTANPTAPYIPEPFYLVRSNRVNEFLINRGLMSDLQPTYSTRDEELQAITSSGFQNQVNAINNATSAVNDVNSSVEDVNQSVMQMIEEITAPYVNVTQEQLPTQQVNDTSAEPLNTLFDYIKDAFTGEPQAFSFPLPFVRW